MTMIDIIIIGAGVVGLAIASEVASKNRDVILLEKNDTFGLEQSSRSSEVIHAGIYCPPEYLKTRLCIEGNELLYKIGNEAGVSCIRCGKIFMAANEADAENLEDLYYVGLNNGLPLKRLSQHELRLMEPNIRAAAAFFSPTSGIMDSHSLMRYFLLKARQQETKIGFRHEVTGVEQIPDGYRVYMNTPEGEDSLDTRTVINCAGIFSDRVAAMAGIDIDAAGYRLYLTKGEFYSVGGDRSRMLKSLVYPPPEPLGPSIHVCFDVERRLRLGPYFYYTDEIDYRVDETNREIFEQSAIMKALPFIKPEDLEPESAGIMGVLYGQGEAARDFVISHEADKGLPGLINLIGLDSPALTASPAIARYVAGMVGEILE